MSEYKLVSPLLDGFIMGNPMNDHDGICCCPAMKENTDEKYIVKIISVPASQVQLDALLLTGAHKDPAEAMDYFKSVADEISSEADILNTLSKLEGFLPYSGCQIVPMEDGKLGYNIYLLSTYKRSLQRYMRKKPITHLEAVNLGLDLCAALAVCRRAGYMYIDLKPSNIFLSKDKQYRIGDLGFVKLDALNFTSLPGKYCSPYTPPEVQDDMKTLNMTVDIYSVGMILYQIYNEGTLPAPVLEPTDAFPHPSNADYEIASIIMKALNPDPSQRWTDPMEMGQALVGYLQRNSVNNNPITPPAGMYVYENSDPVSDDQPDSSAEAESSLADISNGTETPEAVSDAESAEPGSDAEESSEPVQEIAENEEEDLDFSIAFLSPPENEKPEEDPPVVKNAAPAPVKRNRKRSRKGILAAIIALLIIASLACGAFWFYQTQYLQNIDALTLHGSQNELTVTVKTKVDTSHMRVICTDAYGNSVAQPLVDGNAVFTDLLPDSLYRVEITAEGFHSLTGQTADIFTTDALPTIISLSAVTGSENGSVLLNFTVDGADPEEWRITCSTHGEEDIIETFTGHSVTVTGLTPGKVYTLTLDSANGDEVLGSNVIDFTATNLILAENLSIADCTNGVMTVRWDAPADSAVETWNVRCYNDEGHEEVLEIAGTEITFTGIDNTKAYTVEVTATGMTQGSRVSISANPLTVTGLTVDSSADDHLTVNWTFDGTEPEGGWLLMYTLDDNDQQNVVKCDGTTAVISPKIPSTNYHFVLQTADSTSVFNSSHSFVCGGADIFTNQGLSADKITAHLVKTPEDENWTAESIGDDAITHSFQSGDSISVVLKASDKFYLPEMDIEVMYVIRDGAGNVLSSYLSEETRDWKDIWYDANYQNGELTIPKVPEEPGDYSVSIYFNNMAVTATTFSIT